MSTSFSKLKSGEWGVRSTEALTPGGTVQVAKKAGGSKAVTLKNLVWSGNGVWLYAIAPDSSRPAVASGTHTRSANTSRGRWNGCSCGARELPDGTLSANACASCRYDNE